MVNRLLKFLALRPDLGRALRVGVAFLVPLLICHALGMKGDAVFIAMSAQTIALPDLRGAYGMRLLILVTMILVVAGSAVLGVCSGGSVLAATLAMGFLALIGGLWRHLSADYGPALSVASALLFLLGLSQPGPLSAALHLAYLIVVGGAGAAVLHIACWPLRPQHPLRYAVAETWVAASDLIASIRPVLAGEPEVPAATLADNERALRAALDRTFVILGAAKGRQSESLLKHLEDMRVEVVHLSMRVLALHGALEHVLKDPRFARHLPAVDCALKALGDAARSVAITVITHQPGNFAATDVRLRRCSHLLEVLIQEIEGEVQDSHVRAALDRVGEELPRLRKALAETIDHGLARTSFAGRLPELGRRPLSALAAWINPSSQLDPVLVRYSLRMAVLTMLAVLAYKGFDIPRGYWIAFTVVVVLQPDFGSTRQRAGERMLGTLAGALLGGVLISIQMPVVALDVCAAATAVGFAYWLKRRYDVAVFFVTLMLVLLTETLIVVGLDFPITRVLCTLAGGALALTSALFFWPVWEGEKFTALLAGAIRSNVDYLKSIAVFISGEAPPELDLLMVKRRAENANRYAAASLQRLLAEPSLSVESGARASALSTYNQRITRALIAMAVHLPESAAGRDPELVEAIGDVTQSLGVLAEAVERDQKSSVKAALRLNVAAVQSASTGDGLQSAHLRTQLAKAVTEIRAMAIALHLDDAPEERPRRRRFTTQADSMG